MIAIDYVIYEWCLSGAGFGRTTCVREDYAMKLFFFLVLKRQSSPAAYSAHPPSMASFSKRCWKAGFINLHEEEMAVGSEVPADGMFGAHGFIASYWTSEVLPVKRPCIEEEYEGLLYF